MYQIKLIFHKVCKDYNELWNERVEQIIRDISLGKETKPIPVVNEIDKYKFPDFSVSSAFML